MFNINNHSKVHLTYSKIKKIEKEKGKEKGKEISFISLKTKFDEKHDLQKHSEIKCEEKQTIESKKYFISKLILFLTSTADRFNAIPNPNETTKDTYIKAFETCAKTNDENLLLQTKRILDEIDPKPETTESNHQQ